MIRFSKILTIVIVISFQLFLQSYSQIKQLGIFGGIDIINHSTGYDSIPYPLGTIRNLKMTPLNSIGWSAGLRFDYTLHNKLFLGTRLYYSNKSLEFTSDENIKLIKNEQIVEAVIRTDIKSDFDDFVASLEAGYDFGIVSLSIGSSIAVPISNRYGITQSLIDNPDFVILYPNKDTNFLTTKYSKPTYHPFLRLSFAPLKNKGIGETGLNPSIDVAYSYPINSMSKEIDWKFSSLSMSLSVSFSLERLNNSQTIINDTIFIRDTTMLFSENIERDSIYLNNQSIKLDTSEHISISEITQNWIKVLPKPKSLLNGELSAEFIYSDKSASKDCRISYLTHINRWSYLDLNKKILKIKSASDTVVTITLPLLRLHPTIISESGLKELSVNLYEGFHHITTKSFNTNFPDYIDIDVNDIVNAAQLSQKSRTVEIWLTLMDNDNQVFNDRAVIITLNNNQANTSQSQDNYLIIDEKNTKNPSIINYLKKQSVKSVFTSDDSLIKELISALKTKAEILNTADIKNKIPAEFNRDKIVVIEVEN